MTSPGVAHRPVDRPSAPPLETHRVGNTTYRLTPDGVERLRRAKPLTPARSPKRPTLSKAPKVARRDRDQAAWARRVAAHINTTKEKLAPMDLATCAAVVDHDMRLLIMPIRGTVEQIEGAAPRITPTTARSATRHPSPPTTTPAMPHAASPASRDELTPGQKAWRTRQARIARGETSPTDWAAAGRKAWATRQRHAAQARGGGP